MITTESLLPRAAAMPATEMDVPTTDSFRQVRISLRQWRMLHAVIDCGSFSSAAQMLHVTQPAISYAISKLEHQLGVQILKMQGRKAEITEQGTALLGPSRQLLREAAKLEQLAEEMKRARHRRLILS